jgi:hypothetical protein
LPGCCVLCIVQKPRSLHKFLLRRCKLYACSSAFNPFFLWCVDLWVGELSSASGKGCHVFWISHNKSVELVSVGTYYLHVCVCQDQSFINLINSLGT